MGFKYKIDKRLIFKFSILILIIFKLFFLGKGALSYNDECRYMRSYKGLSSLYEKGDFDFFLNEIIINAGNPGFQIYNLIPCSIQMFFEKTFELNHLSFKSLLIPQLFNFAILIFTLIFLYLISVEFLSKLQSEFLILVFLCCLSSTIYLRHLFPYDISILCFLMIIKKMIYIKLEKRRNLFYLGVFSAILFSLYTGYFFLVGIIYALVLINRRSNLIACTFFYFLGFVPIIVFFELLGQCTDTSYIMSLINHSSTISMGDFNEGLTFPLIYIYNTEGLVGIILLLLTIAYGISKIIDTNIKLNFLDQLIVTSLLAFVLYSLQCYFLEKLVWYGRIVHFFIPIMILASFNFMFSLNDKRKKILLTATIICSIFSLGLSSKNYFALEYPREIIEKENINPLLKKSFMFSIDGVLPNYPYFNRAESVVKNSINCGFLWPNENTKIKEYSSNNKANSSYIHYLNFKPYQMECFNQQQRKVLSNEIIMIKIFDIPQK